MNNCSKDCLYRKEKIEKKCKKVVKYFSNFFRRKYSSSSKKENKIIKNDNESEFSSSATIHTPEECYLKSKQIKQFDLTSEATLYTSPASSVISSANDNFYNKINSSTFPLNNPSINNLQDGYTTNTTYTSANDFIQQNNIQSYDNLAKPSLLKRNITRASFYSLSPTKSTFKIPTGNHIPLKLEDRLDTTIPIINNNIAEQIRMKIPALYKEAIHWKLLYSIDQHGLSLNTLYSNIKHAGPCIMAITTDNNEIFGAFTSEPFDPTISSNYYGSGLSFIWKVNDHGDVDFYQTTSGSNQYFMLADNHFIAMGGGNGKFGFYLNENLIDGYISPCMTFNYDSDIIENECFECIGLEIWGFEF